MWNSIWINTNLLTMTKEDEYSIIKNAAIASNSDGKIAWLGKMSELKQPIENLAYNIYDLEAKFLMPAFIDCHTHIVYAGSRANEFEMRLEGVSYEEIAQKGGGIISTVSAVRAASEDELFEASINRIKKAIRYGSAAFEIKSGYGLDLENEEKMLKTALRIEKKFGIKIQKTFLGAHALPPEFKGRADAYIEYVTDEMLPKLAEKRLIDTVDGFCENIAFSAQQIERLFKQAKELNIPIKLHTEQLSNQGGAKLTAKYGGLSADHLEYIDEDGVKEMAKFGTVAVLLPSAFYFLRETQKPPIELFRKYRVPMAIATDCNPGSSPILSLPLVMNMACTLFQMTPFEALKAVTINAARALGWQDIVGSLEIGKDASFSIFDIKEPAELSYLIGSDSCHSIVLCGQNLRFENN